MLKSIDLAILSARERWLCWRLERVKIPLALELAQATIELMEARQWRTTPR